MNKGGNPFADNILRDSDPVSGKSNLHIEAWPNPANGLINISVLADEEIEVFDLILTDLTGRKVYQAITSSNATIDLGLQGLKPGIYILRMSSVDHSGWLRIIFVN